MTQVTTERPRKPGIYRLLVLIFILILISAGYYWYRIVSPQRMYQQALNLSSSHPAEAESLLEMAIQRSPATHQEWLYLRVKLLVNMNRWEEAAGQWSLITDPANLPAEDLCQLAFVAKQQGHLAISEQVFQAAKHEQHLLPDILRSLIQIHLQLGQEDLVIQECHELLEIKPLDSTAWQIIGTVYLTRKDFKEAEDAFRRCLRTSNDPRQISSVRENLIQSLIDSGQLESAQEEWNHLQATSSVLSERAILEYAWLLRAKGEYEQGLKFLKEYFKENRKLSNKALLMRGMLLMDSGQLEDAQNDFQQIINIEPWNKEAHQQLAMVYTRLKKTDFAQKHHKIAEKLNNDTLALLKLNSQLRQNPGDTNLRKQIADLYRSLGKPDLARELLKSHTSVP